jgi:hypothetical protein
MENSVGSAGNFSAPRRCPEYAKPYPIVHDTEVTVHSTSVHHNTPRPDVRALALSWSDLSLRAAWLPCLPLAEGCPPQPFSQAWSLVINPQAHVAHPPDVGHAPGLAMPFAAIGNCHIIWDDQPKRVSTKHWASTTRSPWPRLSASSDRRHRLIVTGTHIHTWSWQPCC